MPLPYAITRSTRRQNETKRSQFREHPDISSHSSALHLHTAHQDTQFSLHPTPRADTRQDLGTPTGQDSACGYITQQPNFCYCLSPSPSRPTHDWVVLLSQKHNTAQAQDSQWTLLPSGQLVKSLVKLRGHCPLGTLGTCPRFGTCGTDTLHGYTRPAMSHNPFLGTGGLPVWEKSPSKQRLTSPKHVWKALKNHYGT